MDQPKSISSTNPDIPSDSERDPGEALRFAPNAFGILRVLRSGWDRDGFWISLQFKQSVGTIVPAMHSLRRYGGKERRKSAVSRILGEQREKRRF